jgi:putative transposase
MWLNDAGQVIHKIWGDLSVKYPDIGMDEFVVMPNHFHGIIVICHDACRGEVSSPIAVSPIPEIKQGEETKEGGDTPPLRRCTLGQIVGYFKYQSSKQINEIRNTPGYPVWQRNYYEHIIRSAEEMNRIREYIFENPLKWVDDEDNPAKSIVGARRVLQI